MQADYILAWILAQQETEIIVSKAGVQLADEGLKLQKYVHVLLNAFQAERLV